MYIATSQTCAIETEHRATLYSLNLDNPLAGNPSELSTTTSTFTAGPRVQY